MDDFIHIERLRCQGDSDRDEIILAAVRPGAQYHHHHHHHGAQRGMDTMCSEVDGMSGHSKLISKECACSKLFNSGQFKLLGLTVQITEGHC